MTTLNWPGFGLASISPTLDQPSQSNSSAWTGTRTVITDPWHGKWSFKVTLATRQGDAAFQAARAFFTSLKGQIGTFHLPAVEAPQNANTGVTLSANAAQGAASLALTGVTTALVAGNMVTIAGQLLSLTSVGSLSGSAQTVSFMPTLRAAHLSGVAVETAKPYALVYLSDSSFTWDIGSWRRYGLSFSATEAVNETDGADPLLDVWTGGTGSSGGGGTSFSFPELTSFISRTLLAAVVGPSDKQVAYLTEAGREGDFVFSTANLSTSVTADPQQGIYVAPAADTTGASGAWVRKFTGPLVATWFGEKHDTSSTGVGGTDDTTANNAAIAEASAEGGGVVKVRGHSRNTGAIDLSSKYNIALKGRFGYSVGYSQPPPDQLICDNTGSAPFINGASAEGILISDYGVRYKAGYTGDLVAFTNLTSPFTPDAAYCRINGAFIGGLPGAYGARSAVSLEGCILSSITNSRIMKAVAGIRGVKYVGPANYLYSNGTYLANLTISGCTEAGVLNPGQGTTLVSIFYEGTDDGDGSGGMPYCIKDSLPAGSLSGGIVSLGGWAGDLVNASDTLITNGNTGWYGFGLFGGAWIPYSGAIPVMKLTTECRGVSVQAVACSSFFSLGSIPHYGVNLSGNQMLSDVVGIHANSDDLAILANALNSGYAENTLRLHKVKEWRVGYNGAAGGTGTFDWHAAASTALNFNLNADNGQSKLIYFKRNGNNAAYFGLDAGVSENVALVTYDNAAGFVGYPMQISRTTMDVTWGGHVLPAGDNAKNLGSSGNRWATVYAGTGTVNTSDRQHKSNVRKLSSKEFGALLDAVGAVPLVAFKFNDAVKAKGKAARDHYGVIAQDLHDELIKRGLDPFAGGVLGRDLAFEDVEEEYEADEPVTETRTEEHFVTEVLDGKAVQRKKLIEVEVPVTDMLPVHDEDGNPVMVLHPDYDSDPVRHPETNRPIGWTKTIEKQKLHEATRLKKVTKTRTVSQPKLDAKGEQEWIWNVRYSEFQTLRQAWAEREMKRTA